jgi:hypothetical protein
VDRDGASVVYVVDIEGIVRAQPVSIGRELGNDAYVSSGLTGSESIIMGAILDRLKPGDRVEVSQ